MASLEQLERAAYRAKPAPLDGVMEEAPISAQDLDLGEVPCQVYSLDGMWEMAMGGNADRVYACWEDTIAARVPGSVHAALIEVGRIPDPTMGKQDAIAREMSRRRWWLRKKFSRPEDWKGRFRLEFGGICDRCTIWLNGRLLGGHQGMFGGPEFDVTDLLEEENTLTVMLYPAPYRIGRVENELNPFFDDMNIGWVDTTVFNCVYGWHYANIPALGIWRSVTLRCVPEAEIEDVFAKTLDTQGNLAMRFQLAGPEGGFQGELRVEIAPANFAGEAHFWSIPFAVSSMHSAIRRSFHLPDPRLWWPNGLGAQNLYEIRVVLFLDGVAVDQKQLRFGLRTIEMLPDSDGENSERYNWQFAVNGEKIFVKGANWCTIDFAMRFSRERYERFLSLARDQHIQFLRAWGGGMPETDDFYALCDEYGIMVLQEFATAWDSQKFQPADILREGVIRTVRRLRNHASLALWGGGNESPNPVDAVIDMMGRIVYELDGTRVFHRSDPWGGSSHNYSVYWGREDFDYNLHYTAPFIGEFGFASSPNLESVHKYIPAEEMQIWPPTKDGSYTYHTPVYDKKDDVAILNGYIEKYMPNTSMENMVLATQLSQVTTLRHTLELARTRRPAATGICYYKLTDVWPAISWSTIDYYGVPKMAYYFVRHSYAPLAAFVLFSTLQPMGKEQTLPVWLVDDAKVLEGRNWKIVCTVYDGQLRAVGGGNWSGRGNVGYAKKVGDVCIEADAAKSVPLFIVIDLFCNEERVEGTFYWLNFEAQPGCLYQIPRTQLRLEKQPGRAIVTNAGTVPALGVEFVCDAISGTFACGDNFFALAPGETRAIPVNRDDYSGMRAFNAESV